ncbi:hypothetical protein VTN77DRAFT_3232 [Rasamsonia byssochlamydoides]|uniref:uncharacterized protein n=1 Tax=Rasamsonia byssochlamydoides TaxID=89139 RepID=UPI0037430AD6
MFEVYDEDWFGTRTSRPLTKEVGNIRIRPATLEDLPRVADLLAQAMLYDEVSAFLYPKRLQYYAHYRDSLLRRLRQQNVTPGWVLCVAVQREIFRPADNREGLIVGYCAWERIGRDRHARKWQQSKGGFWNGLERTLLSMTEHYYSILGLDKSLDRQRLADYNSGSMACFPFEQYPDLWYLENVAVHPAYQRRGIGRLLVRWGMEHADVECVPVGLEANVTRTKLWEKLGFMTINEIEAKRNVRLRAMLWDAIYLID